MTDTQPTRTAGRVGPHRESHEPRLLITNFVAMSKHITVYTNWDGSKGIIDWGIDGNDVLGDCGAAGTDHGNVAKKADASVVGTLGEGVVPMDSPSWSESGETENYTEATYFAYGRAMGESGQFPDNGVDNASWLAYLYKLGVIKGYAEIPLESIDLYAPTGSGLLFGLQIDGEQSISDFNNHVPWDTQTNIDGGHDTWLIKLNEDGSGALVTWGAIQEFTLGFRQNNVTDAWLIFDTDDQVSEWPGLEAALQALHGVGGQ